MWIGNTTRQTNFISEACRKSIFFHCTTIFVCNIDLIDRGRDFEGVSIHFLNTFSSTFPKLFGREVNRSKSTIKLKLIGFSFKIRLTNWTNFKIPGIVWKYPILNLTQLRAPCGWAAGFGCACGCLFGSTVTTVSDIMIFLFGVQRRKIWNSFIENITKRKIFCFSLLFFALVFIT